MASTLLLDTVNWDLVVDANSNIAMANEPYALAQDAASAIKLFQGELWYDTTQGVPYFGAIINKLPPLSYIKQKFVAAALTVPDITAARVFITAVAGRQISGQVQIISASTSKAVAANF